MLTNASSCASERHADRLWREALDRVAQGDTKGAVDRLQTILERYPSSSAAERARGQIIVYRGLLQATQAYPGRRAREIMVQVARAIEAYRHAHARAPASLDGLVPTLLPAVPMDPWNRPFAYAATATGYRLSCLGSDGAAGGAGDAADLIVINGAFTQDPS